MTADEIEQKSGRSYADSLSEYRNLSWNEDEEARLRDYAKLTNDYYDLVTDFYEFGWGKCFHFAPLHRGEGLKDAIEKYESRFARDLEVGQGAIVLDLGCGVGGPMMNIAEITGAKVTGINNNEYQIGKGRGYIEKAGLSGQCSFLKCDFMNLPMENGSVDAVYSIEAIPHAPDKESLFREIRRVLKPGGKFVASDWCVTRQFDPKNDEHVRAIRGMEIGSGLPYTFSTEETLSALKKAGFEVVRSKDLVEECDSETPWYRPLSEPTGSILNIVKHPRSRFLLSRLLAGLEFLRILPKGTAFVHRMLSDGGEALVRSGEAGIFTPMFYFCARNPE